MRLIVCLCLVAPPAAAATNVSSIAIGPRQESVLGLEYVRTVGARPGFLPDEARFVQNSYWYRARGGFVGVETDLGSQFGIEYEMKLGVTPNESAAPKRRRPVGFAVRVGTPYRAAAFNVPCAGMLAFHASMEFAAGGAHWWSDSVRLRLMGGARLALKLGAAFRFETDYTVVPLSVTGTSFDLDVDRLEHQLLVSIGYDVLFVGSQLQLARTRSREGHTGPRELTEERSFSIYIGMRMEED